MANTRAVLGTDERWRRASDIQELHEESKFQPLVVKHLKEALPMGLIRGAITEINGPHSTGRTALSLHILACATAAGETCAIVDLNDSFSPASAASVGVQLQHLVWIRCTHNPEHAMRAADLLVHAGGFGVVALDLCDADVRMLNRIPLSYWYRFRRAIELTPTVLLVCANIPQTISSSINQLQIKPEAIHWAGRNPFALLEGVGATVSSRKLASIHPAPLQILHTAA